MNPNDEKISKTIQALELHQLRTLVDRVRGGGELSRADMALLKQLGAKLELKRTPEESTTTPKKTPKKKRGRPSHPIKLATKIECLALAQIHARQERGEKLTAAEFAFVERIKQAHQEKTVPEQSPPSKPPLAERMGAFREKMFESLCWVVQNSKSHMARVSAVLALKTWYDETAQPLEGFEVCELTPEEMARMSN